MSVEKLIFFSLALFSNLGFASESHGINWWHLGSAYKDAPALGWLTITFLIFVYLVVRAIKKPLSLYLETRSKDIRQKIEEGHRAKKESEEKLKLYDEKLKTLSGEIEKLKASFEHQALSEKKERERLAHELEQRILREADDTIKADYERSKNRLAEEVIIKAFAIAQETIEGKQREAIDKSLKASFMDDLKMAAKERQQ